MFLIFVHSRRFQEEGVSREASDRHHSQLHQQEHYGGGQGGRDQRRGLHLQPEVLPRPQRGDRCERSAFLPWGYGSGSLCQGVNHCAERIISPLPTVSVTDWDAGTTNAHWTLAGPSQSPQMSSTTFTAQPVIFQTFSNRYCHPLAQVLIWRTLCTTRTTHITLSWLPRNRACWTKESSLM